jgi:predicted Rossmann fold nucleotide-binding protein DprA/Smf involved in DNA uptake
MKIAIIGSRNYSNLDAVKMFLNNLAKLTSFSVITGGARGVDTVATSWCKEHNVQCETIRPVNLNDKFSYLLRNVEIITKADKVIAFWDGESRGTKFVINYCKIRNKDLQIIE